MAAHQGLRILRGSAPPSRVYLSDGAYRRLNMAEHRALGRFRSMSIVRSLGPRDGRARVTYPGDFAEAKRPDGGIVAISAMIAQPYVTTLADAMSGELQPGNVGRVSDLLDSYAGFVRQLWLHGVCHLDFSILNVGLSGHRGEESLVLFDPHMGVIELSPAGPEVRDPLAARPQEQRSLAELLRAARDGSRWALWRIQEMAASAPDIPEDQAAEAAEIVKRFHLATGPVDQGNGLFSHQRFGRTWHRRPVAGINELARAHTRQLLVHPLWALIRRVLEQRFGDRVYQRQVPVLAMGSDSVLPQFLVGLTVYERHPLLLIANAWGGPGRLTRHWGRVVMPGELGIQDDPGISYHFRDLLTGGTYARSGETLARRGEGGGGVGGGGERGRGGREGGGGRRKGGGGEGGGGEGRGGGGGGRGGGDGDECQEARVYDTPVGEVGDILRIRFLFDLYDNLVDFAVVLMTGSAGTERMVARADISHTGLHVHWFRPDGTSCDAKRSVW